MLATAPAPAPPSPHDYSLHHLFHHPAAASPPPAKPPSPHAIASTWLAAFAAALAHGGTLTQLAPVFHAESWWRDHLALSWDLRTLHTLPRIAAFVAGAGARLGGLRLVERGRFAAAVEAPAEGLEWVEGMFVFECAWGVGKGVVRLVEDGAGVWKCCMFYAALQELRGVTAAVGHARPHGGDNSLGGEGEGKWSWLERRRRVAEFEGVEPDVVVIGAGKWAFLVCDVLGVGVGKGRKWVVLQ